MEQSQGTPAGQTGKQSVKKLVGQNQGVDQTELSDRQEAKSFDRYARKYGVDYAIKRGRAEDGAPRYIVFFKARDRAAIDQAMRAYANDFLDRKREKQTVQPVLDSLAPGKKKERAKRKGLER